MQRTLRVVPLLALALAAGLVHAQDMMGRRASLFDLGIYGGGAYTTDWFTTPEVGGEGDEGWSPGLSPIFGATATYWLSPAFGVRLNGAYMPSSLPEAEGVNHPDQYGLTNWLYDLDLVWRPFFASDGAPWTASTILFLGGGAISSSATGQDGGNECFSVYLPWPAAGVCLSTEGITAPRGVLGAEVDVTTLGRTTLFVEGALHGFPAPVRICDEAPCEDDGLVPGDAQRKFVVMPRLVLGTRVGFGER